MLHGWCVRVLGLCAALAACLAAAAPAGAQQPAACLEGFDCLTVTVPLDRSGAIAGTLELPVAVQRGDEPVLLALGDRKSTRLNSSHRPLSRMPSSA